MKKSYNRAGAMAALYHKMKNELSAFKELGVPMPTRDIEHLFDTVVKTAKDVVFFQEREVNRIFEIAKDIYLARDIKHQKLIFNRMKKLISVFGKPGTIHRNRVRAPNFTSFARFYFNVVFCRPGDKSLRTEASRDALQYIDCHALKWQFLQALNMSQFDNYPIEYFEKEGVKNLLRIVTAKLNSKVFDEDETATPYIINFLHSAIEEYDSCGLNSRVCETLAALFKFCATGRAREDLSAIRGGRLIYWILSHIRRYKKTCWWELPKFLESSFKYGDASVKYELVDQGVFESNTCGIKYMFLLGGPTVLGLLSAIEAACSRTEVDYMDLIVSKDVMKYIMPYVKAKHNDTNIRMRARRVVNAFFRAATPEQVLEVARNGMAQTLIKLLKSKNDDVVIDAEKWLFLASDILLRSRNSELVYRFQSIVSGQETFEALNEALSSRNSLIRDGAEILLHRIQLDCWRRLSSREEDLLEEQRRHIHAFFPA